MGIHMVTESGLLLRVYQACAFGDSGRMHPQLSARVDEFGPDMSQRQQDCLVALAREHIGGELLTNEKWSACAELVEAVKLLNGVGGTAVECHGEKVELWARDNTYFFTSKTDTCDCTRFARDKKFCMHLMTLALVLAGMD